MATTIRLSMNEWTGYLRKLGKDFMPAAKRGLKRGALHSQVLLQQRTSALGVLNTGAYKRSWKWQEIEKGIVIYNAQLYAGVIEYGRRVGARMPPVEPIARWAQLKLGVPKKQARGVGFVIARAISRRGIAARPVMTGALPKMEQAFKEAITAELKRSLAATSRRGGKP